MPLVPTRLGEVSYQIQGEGQPVVLLHANLHDRHDYDTIVPKLSKKYQTIAVDWPWHGESNGLATVENLSAVSLADVLEDFVSALNLPPALFIGNSVGGFACARLAITQPDRVLGLVLINNGGFVEWPFLLRLFCRVLGTPFFARLILPSMVSQYMRPQTAQDEEIMHRAVARARTSNGASVAAALWRSFPDSGHDLRPRADKIKARTLIAWGVNDPTFPKGAEKDVQKCIPGSTVELFHTGHVVFSSKPEEFLHVVELFFQSILAGTKA